MLPIEHKRKLAWAAALTSAALLGGTGCARDILEVTRANLVAESTLIDFGAVPEGAQEARQILLENSGGVEMTATLTVAEGSSADFVLGSAEVVVEGGGQETIEVTYTPTERGSDEGLVVIDAGDAGTAEVTLRGGPIAPELRINPSPVLFGPTDQLQIAQEVTLINDGLANVTLAEAEIMVVNLDFALTAAPELPLILGPGRHANVTVTYTRGLVAEDGTLEVRADDGETPAPLVSHPVPLIPYPLAACADGLDNDLDGLIDFPDDRGCADLEDDDEVDPAACITGSQEPCGLDEGACVAGERHCVDSTWGPCENDIGPELEDCDGIDNDCDTRVDEELIVACTIDDCPGSQACVEGGSGTWETCVAGTGEIESCNGLDDDCNGTIDEGVVQVCSINNCDGNRSCIEAGGGTWDPCLPDSPEPEICDGNDNDCNGQIDESLSQPCDVNGCAGEQLCGMGTWGLCAPLNPQPEVCDGADNNCDGQADEALSQTCTIYGCDGNQVCTTGVWGTCVPTAPQPETCDNVDENCNGLIDDALAQSCTVYGCDGIQICMSGVWGTCVPTSPQTETCNNVDDNCNGIIDDAVAQACTIYTCSGTQACTAGVWGSCIPSNPPPEICDNVDNNCNGLVDDALSQPCTINGCAGTQACSAGVWGSCIATNPQPESCDNVDNNCNGQVDELLTQACTINTCAGTETCSAGSWGTCVATNPQPEVCDGADNNCDGQVDEGGVCSCVPNGTFTLDGGPVSYSCCMGLVSVNVSSFVFSDDGATVTGSPTHPVTMTGSATTCPVGAFAVTDTIPGGCAETYTLTGDFTGPDTWTGTYTLDFVGGDCGCWGLGACVSQVYPVSATR